MTSTITEADIERELASRDFMEFVPYVKVLDPPPSGGGAIPYEPWPHLQELIFGFRRERLIVIPKPKQIGVSWLLAAYAYWTAAYHNGAQVLEFSKGQLEAKDLLRKSAFIHRNLPVHIQGDAEIFAEEIRFPSMDARILALPSTPDAGIGQTATLVIMDEADFHDYLSENYDSAAKPTVDAGGQLVMVSTINPEKVGSPFQMRLRGAGERVAGDNGFARFFYSYDVRPGRDAAWYERSKAEADNPHVFVKNYPRSLEEALAPSRGIGYFDSDALEIMAEQVREPESVERGLLSVWRKAVIGGRYIIGADTAWGQSGSYSCATVFAWAVDSMEQVAEMHGRPHPDECAFEILQLHKDYNHAYMGLERAGEGQERDGESVVVVDKVMELLKECECRGRNRVFYSDYRSDSPERPGWQTDRNSRPYMLSDLQSGVRNGQVVIRSKGGHGEMMSFLRNEKGRAQAADGAHDDRVMAYAIGWRMREFASFGSIDVTKPLVYPSFAGGGDRRTSPDSVAYRYRSFS